MPADAPAVQSRPPPRFLSRHRAAAVGEPGSPGRGSDPSRPNPRSRFRRGRLPRLLVPPYRGGLVPGCGGRNWRDLTLVSPPHSVGDDPPDLRLAADRVGLVTGTEVEHPAPTAAISPATPKDFAAPAAGADEEQLIGLRDVGELPVHLLLGNYD